LAHLREVITEDSGQEEIQYLRDLERKIRKEKRWEAIIWRRRSRVKWLSIGEAPSRYFFAQMKGKYVRDTIHALTTENQGTATTDEELIKTVHDHVATRFTTNEQVRQNDNEQDLATQRKCDQSHHSAYNGN
jgi:hypothetical protein